MIPIAHEVKVSQSVSDGLNFGGRKGVMNEWHSTSQ